MGLCIFLISCLLVISLCVITLPFFLANIFGFVNAYSKAITILIVIVVLLFMSLVSSVYFVFVQGSWLFFFAQISMQKNSANEIEKEESPEKNEVLSPDAA